MSLPRPLSALRPPSPEPAPCKVCGDASPLFGVTDFNRSCEEHNGLFLPLLGQPVYYRRCGRCGLLFTDSFDDWGQAEFEAHIYNTDYVLIDPEFVETRPRSHAGLVTGLFAEHAGGIDVLDYGGGAGGLAAHLREAGFRSAATYDPFNPEFSRKPEGRFQLITCYETLEHLPNPRQAAAEIAELLQPDGVVLFSTLVQPEDIDDQRMQWWYIGPRNGHVTLYSRLALATLWADLGFQLASFNESHHLAFRQVPAVAAHLFQA